MVTKGYQKGVYERVTMGIMGGTGALSPLIQLIQLIQKRDVVAEAVECNLPAALWKGATSVARGSV